MNQGIMDIMKYKRGYLMFSLLVLLPGIYSLLRYGLNLSIDFTGGSVFQYQAESPEFIKNNREELEAVFNEGGAQVESIVTEGDGSVFTVRTKPIDSATNEEIKNEVLLRFFDTNIQQLSTETVGPAIGAETTKNAFVALGWASIGIVLYIAYAFRNIPKPYSSFRFGVSAIIAMLHDALLVLGVFSILGHWVGVEVDSLFLTAVLTVIGFSVHDSIVVFDRIRENLSKMPKMWSFEQVTDYSVVETLGRSLATSLTVLITLLSLHMLGGESIKNFTLALLIGIISGTYSSIFTASPILVIWEEFSRKKKV